MTVEHRKTGKKYAITREAWEAMQLSGKVDAYRVIESPETPKEVKNVRRAKPAESDNNGSETIDDRLPVHDIGEIE